LSAGAFFGEKTGGIIFIACLLGFFNRRCSQMNAESFLAAMQVDVFFAKLISGSVARVQGVLILI
jgi:hypothetical protein